LSPTKYWYARVSSKEQAKKFYFTSQKEVLASHGILEHCIFTEIASATELLNKRPVLYKLIKSLEAGDSLLVTKLDRFFRNTLSFLQIKNLLAEKYVDLRVLYLPQECNLNLASSQLLSPTLAAIAEFETTRRRERQKQGNWT
jgi:DNA invertase Pin-like site-specific DNA recombinase